MRAINAPIMTALSAAVSQASAAVPTSQVFYISVQAVVTGTSSGTLKLQFSNDPCEGVKVPVPTNWIDIPSASVTITGTPGAFGISKTELSYRFIRAVYTFNNAASGTITVTINGMGA